MPSNKKIKARIEIKPLILGRIYIGTPKQNYPLIYQ